MPHSEPPGPSRPNGLPPERRLKRKALIRPLFDRNRKDVGSVAAGCVRVVYRKVPRAEVGLDVPVQAGFTAGRAARTAVARNRVKRVMREVYRVHQHALVDLLLCTDACLTLMVLFRGNPDAARICIPRDLPEALRRLASKMRLDVRQA